MGNYFEARLARYKRNSVAILELIKLVMEADSEIEVYLHRDCITGSDVVSSVTFFKGEQINSISFHEVPYGWSGCGHKEHGGYHKGGENHSLPFEVADVLTTFKPVTNILSRQPSEFFKTKEEYLKWCSWLVRFEGNINQ